MAAMWRLTSADALRRGNARGLSPERPAPASPGGAVRVSRYWFAPAPGEGKRQAPGESNCRAAPGQRKPAASQCAEYSDGDSDSGDRGTGVRGVSESVGNFTPSWVMRMRCVRSGGRCRWDRAVGLAFLWRMRSGGRGQRGRAWLDLRRWREEAGRGRPGARRRGGRA
jgi:hypothetical protein